MLHRTYGYWRKRPEASESKHPANIARTVHVGGGYVIVWGIGSWHSLDLLIIVDSIMDQYKYASALVWMIVTFMGTLFFLRLMGSTNRKMRSVIQLVV
ncbi:hypothetical protein TNCV_2923741 [Trichonephila clavipes]|nr:hypothetical protein TNCV_2923741 [Trichonephila clavipes]